MRLSPRAGWFAAAHVAACAMGAVAMVAVLRGPEAPALALEPRRDPFGSLEPSARAPVSATALPVASSDGPPGAATAPPVAEPDSAVEASPGRPVLAIRHGALGVEACAAELRRRGIPHAVAKTGAPDVRSPLRLTGPIRGVAFHGSEPVKTRGRSPYEIADCRLLVALDDLAGILAARGVTEVVHMSMHRPGAHKPGGRPSQHQLGLAIDIGALVTASGKRIDLRSEWHGAIGAPPCGPGSSPAPSTPEALELRSIVCAIRDAGLFNVILTPNHDKAHADHVHLDLTPGATWSELH